MPGPGESSNTENINNVSDNFRSEVSPTFDTNYQGQDPLQGSNVQMNVAGNLPQAVQDALNNAVY